MSENASTSSAEESLQNLYYMTRYPALALALALTLDRDKAFDASEKAHILEGGRREGKADLRTVLRRLLRVTPLIEEADDVCQPVLKRLAGLDREARIVWTLRRVCGFSTDETIRLLSKPSAAADVALTRAERLLKEQDANSFKQLVSEMLEKKELWSDITFGITQRKSLNRRIIRVFGLAVLAAVLFFLGREALFLARVLSLDAQAPEQTLYDRYDSELLYKRFPERPSADNPRVNQPLMERLNGVSDGQMLRVAFRFYDNALMRETRTDGQNLEELYTVLYNETLDRGRVNTLMANALNAYYANYRRPFRTEDRESDFQSVYESVYHAALDIARGSDFKQTSAQHPEIFKSRESFQAYLSSPDFINEAPYLYPLISLEMKMSSVRQENVTEPPRLRQEYEDALFAFTNPGGYGGKVSVNSFPFRAESLKSFFALREKLGKEFYALNVRQCGLALPEDASLSSDILEGSESSLFSATLTKKDILRLADQDARFFFLGVTPPKVPFFEGRIEAELALLSRAELLRRHEVYLINEEYLLYSINYAAPLKLPQGFIDEIRAKLNCEDTGFEMEVQYHYQMRYAHPQTRSGYGILRALLLNDKAQFVTRQYKYFSRMASY